MGNFFKLLLLQTTKSNSVYLLYTIVTILSTSAMLSLTSLPHHRSKILLQNVDVKKSTSDYKYFLEDPDVGLEQRRRHCRREQSETEFPIRRKFRRPISLRQLEVSLQENHFGSGRYSRPHII